METSTLLIRACLVVSCWMLAGCSSHPGQSDAGRTDASQTDASQGDRGPLRLDVTPFPVGPVGPNGGTLDTLSFAIVGDTRPALEGDTAAYPTAIIRKIWEDVEAEPPHVPFAITTGDYMYARASTSIAEVQLGIYLQARDAYKGITFAALGNHECTGATASNCGPGNADGETNNYKAFMAKLVQPLGLTQPYHSFQVTATDRSWTAKFVILAANAWSAAQESWAQATLAQATTYTFIIRHEPAGTTETPGVGPSAKLIAQYPYTLLIAGHTHTCEHSASKRQLIVGNGGAPLTGSVNYGYVIARQRADGALELTAKDYQNRGTILSFAVDKNGTKVP